jgi:DNA repair protein RadC
MDSQPDAQLTLLPDITPAESIRQKKHVREILDKMSKLNDELNAAFSYRSEAPQVHGPGDAADLLIPSMAGLETEEFRVLLLNTRNKVIAIRTIYRGSANSAQIRVGEVFRQAIIENATSIVCAHNHPSGDPTPSPDDVAVTRAIAQAGKLLDIELLDHLVIGGARFVSLKERGLGF